MTSQNLINVQLIVILTLPNISRNKKESDNENY